MLRLLVLTLLLLNGMVFAWYQGWLLPYGWGPATQREPQRMAQQIRPEALKLVKEADVAAPPPVAVCLQTVALDAAEAEALRSVLQNALPGDAWTMDALTTPSQWLVYMGKFANAADVTKKRAQLAGLGLKFYPLGNAAFEPGLSLGSHPSKEQAEAALEALKLRGVRTARVLEDAPAAIGYRLRLQAGADRLQKPLAELNAVLAGKPLMACPVAAPAPP